jgi:retron-type reverse transcriptase
VSDLLSSLGRVALLPEHELIALIRSAPYRYKVYQIPKRAPGQFRTIAQPAREVKALQYWVMNNVLNKFEVHPTAMGYRKGRSIAHNARPHTRGRFLLKMDFKDFFPSLKARDFRNFLKKHGPDFDKETVQALCRILFWRPKGTQDLCLSIGAPTSPLLSNILMFEFDRRVFTVCSEHGVAYTRYADDLSFSTAKSSDPLAAVEEAVHEICRRLRSPSLTLNLKKTVRVSKRDSRRMTGLVLTNDRKVSLGRDMKRKIRAWVHHSVTDRLSEEQTLQLRGMLNYVNSVEPAFLQRLIDKYGVKAIRRIQAGH